MTTRQGTEFSIPTDIHGLFAMLEAKQLRYVVVGGLALVLHGVDRLTADVDLAVDLTPDAATQFVDALVEAGYRPAAPVDARLFADPDVRAGWWRDRGMRVFSTIDIFTRALISFKELWRDKSRNEIAGGLAICVASVPHLIQLKELAGRPQDLADIKRLRNIGLGEPEP